MPSDDTSCDGFQFLLKQDIAVGFGLGALLIVVELITCARTLRRDVGHDHVAAGENTKRPASGDQRFQGCGGSHIDGGKRQARCGEHVASEREERIFLHHAVSHHVSAVTYQIGPHAEHVGVKFLKGADISN